MYVPPDDDDVDDDSDDDVNDDDADDDADDDTDDDVDDDIELEPTWVVIPSGEFMMGCSPGDDMCEDVEQPRHRVIITKDFEMTETEVTQAQFENTLGFNPSTTEGCPNCPVEFVVFPEAEEFCEAYGGRLPTEAEWEYAARAGAETRYVCGNDVECLYDYAWFTEEEGVNEVEEPQPVGCKLPNAFGLYDVLGNVGEYVSDKYQETHYETRPDPDVDPQGPGPEMIWLETGIVRGGPYWFNYFNHVRLSSRFWKGPYTQMRNKGFRCARDIVVDEK